MKALWAEEVLAERGGSLSSSELFRVLLMAGYPEKEAAVQAARRALDETRKV